MFLHLDSEDSDQIGQMPRLIRVLLGAQVILLVLSCSGSIMAPVNGYVCKFEGSLTSESSLYALWVAKDPMLLHTNCEDSDQTGRMPRLI